VLLLRFAQGFDADGGQDDEEGGHLVGLYLCIFDDEEEVDGVEVGAYAEFDVLRDYIVEHVEGGDFGSRCPTFVLHSDCDGEWSVADCGSLRDELALIETEFKARPPVEFRADWQRVVARRVGLQPRDAFESFIDVDGEFLIARLQQLTRLAIERGLPILFQ
jgi:Immunity protein 70